MLKPEVIKTLCVTALILSGLGTAISVADTVRYLVQGDLIGEVWLTLIILGLLSLASLLLMIFLYKLVELPHFTIFVIIILALINTAFRVMRRL